MLRQGLIGVLPALVFGLLGAQFGATLFADSEQLLQVRQRGGELLGIEVAVVLCLMLRQALIAFLKQDFGLLDGFFALLQAMTQVTDLLVVDTQQFIETAVVELRVQGSPVGDLAAQGSIFGFQRHQAFLLGLEFRGQLHQ
ncbi:hypothetical protein D3C72_1771360 [compost metagenome]